MFKIYFKQAIAMLKQNRLISTVSILGTALAVMMIMVIVMVQHINVANLAPEVNRDRTLYIKFFHQESRDTVRSMMSGFIPIPIFKNYLSELKKPEAVSHIWRDQKDAMVRQQNSKNIAFCSVTKTDDNYWKIISFNFLEGKPFDKSDYTSGLKKAVINEKTAQELFGKTSAIGKSIEVNFTLYIVVGVIEDVSPIFTYSQGDVFIPTTSVNNYENGWCNVLILAKSKGDFDEISQEVRNTERKWESENPTFKINFRGPYDQVQQRKDQNSIFDDSNLYHTDRLNFLILLILFVVPALNLSSFSLSQIKKRSEEIGVRKAFGAKKYTILIQVLYENFVTSLLGGMIGVVFSSFLIVWLREWLLDIPKDGSIPAGAFISPFVFLAVFVVCLLLNLISAGIPALRTTKMNIVDSLNRK